MHSVLYPKLLSFPYHQLITCCFSEIQKGKHNEFLNHLLFYCKWLCKRMQIYNKVRANSSKYCFPKIQTAKTTTNHRHMTRLLFFPYLLRYFSGVIPYLALNSLLKYDTFGKPLSCAMSSTLASLVRSISSAFARR